MMPNTNPKEDTKTNLRTRAVENNPCGMCRAFGLPICRGHAGGGGAGGDSGNSSDDNMLHAQHRSSVLNISPDVNEIKQSLIQTEAWNLSEDTDLVLEFTEANALLNITLNLEMGSLVFRGNRELSEEEQKALDELFDVIEQELTLFKNELIEKNKPIEAIKTVRDSNSLSIKIPDPKYFDLFVQKLIDKNVLPNHLAHQQQQKNDMNKLLVLDSSELKPDEYKSTAPNPFDINGPKPKGWDRD